jgi:hypothetical protein
LLGLAVALDALELAKLFGEAIQETRNDGYIMSARNDQQTIICGI